MTVVALTSARGAPGVSTAALAMTLLWPRPALLVEADAGGGSSVLAGYLRGTVDHSRGLLGLAMAHRHDELEQALWSQTVPLTTQAAGPHGASDRWVLPGLSDAAQAPSTTRLWGPLASLLTSLERAGTDVLIDAGRLGAAHAPTPLLRQADLVLLVLGTGLPAVAAARARLAVLREDLAVTDSTAGHRSCSLGLLLVGEGRPYTAREITASLGVPVVACLSWDPASAEVLASGAAPGRRFASSAMVRSVRAAISASQDHIDRRRDRLGRPPTQVMAGAGPSQVDLSPALRLPAQEAAGDR